MMKTFSDRQSNVQDFTSRSTKFKEHIAQDMDRVGMNDLCYLIELFKDDESFSKYLLICLLDKMSKGKKLDLESFTIAFLNSLQHKEHLPDLVDALFSYENFFHGSSNEFYYKILAAATKYKLYESNTGIRLIKTIQVMFARGLNQAFTN